MDITEKDFIKLKPVERELILFKNTEAILKQQSAIRLHQKVQYVVMSGITIFLGWLAVIHIR